MVCYRRRGPQRGRRPVDDQPADVRDHRQQALGPQALHRGADRPRRHHPGGGRGGAARLPGSSWSRSSRRPGTRPADGQARPADETAAGEPPVDTAITVELDEADRRRARHRCRDGFTAHPRLSRSWTGAPRWPTDGHIDWGFGEIIAFGSLAARRRDRPAGRPGLPPRHVRRSGTRCSSTPTPATSTCRCGHLADDAGPVLRVRLAAQRVRGDGLRVRLLGGEPGRAGAAGRRSSATSSTARRPSSTSSSPPARSSGASGPASTLLLPHGHEGQGPDHTSGPARAVPAAVRRGQHAVAIPTTPANYFHLLRRQALAGKREAAGRVHARSRCCGAGGDLAGRRTSPPARSSRCCADPTPRRPGVRGQARCCSAPARSTTTCQARRQQNVIRDTAILRLEQLLPAAGRARSEALLARTRTRRGAAGCRRSRPTRAPGRTWPSGCRRCSAGGRS